MLTPFRWSDGRTHAVEFATTQDSFVRDSLEAFKKFYEDLSGDFIRAELHIKASDLEGWRGVKGSKPDSYFVIFNKGSLGKAEYFIEIEKSLRIQKGAIDDGIKLVIRNEEEMAKFVNSVVESLPKYGKEND